MPLHDGTPRSDVFLRRSFMGVNLRGSIPVSRVLDNAAVMTESNRRRVDGVAVAIQPHAEKRRDM